MTISNFKSVSVPFQIATLTPEFLEHVSKQFAESFIASEYSIASESPLSNMLFTLKPMGGGHGWSYEYPKLTPKEIKARNKAYRLEKKQFIETMTSGVYFELDTDREELVLVNKTRRDVIVRVRAFSLDSDDAMLKNVVFVAEEGKTANYGIGNGKRKNLDASYTGTYKVEYSISDLDVRLGYDKMKTIRKVEVFEVSYGSYHCGYCGRKHCDGVDDSSLCEEH